MFRVLTLTLITVMALALPVTAPHAQKSETPQTGNTSETKADGDSAPDKNSDQITVGKEHINDLIKTLESETARTEFLDKLKTLLEADQKNSNAAATTTAITDTLGLDRQINSLIDHYENFLQKHNLSGSIIGKAGITFGALIVAFLLCLLNRRTAYGLRDRLNRLRDRYYLTHNRFRRYARGLRYTGYILILFFLLYTLGIIWNITSFNFIKSDMAIFLVGNFLSIVFIAAVTVILWEAINGYIEYYLKTAGDNNISNFNRLRTLLPIIQNILFIAFAVIFTLILLSEVGINIIPLLAGAGILGIAIGFGAQTMVKDFLTGFTIILEDVVQVGDIVQIAGHIGKIERITMRKIQLRDLAGIVYTIPYSEITTVQNWTKEFSYYVFEIGVAYRENTDEVVEYLKEIDEEMREDAAFKHLIMEPLDILGLDAFGDSAVIIKARIKTRPIEQWKVGREFNRRMKIKFDAHNVEIPFPHQTLYFGEDKQGKAPPAPVMLQEAAKATNQNDKSGKNGAPKPKGNKDSKAE